MRPHCNQAISIMLAFLIAVSLVGCPKKHSTSNSRKKSESKKEEGIETALTAGDSKDTDQKGTVTVDGKDVTPEEKELLTNMAKELFSKALGEATKKVFSEILQKLDISSEEELTLLYALPEVEEAELVDGPMSIYLIKPGKFSDGSQTIVWAVEGEPFIRLTRASGPVNRPVAIITVTGVLNGQPVISEWVLVYNKDGKWANQRPSKRTENTTKKLFK